MNLLGSVGEMLPKERGVGKGWISFNNPRRFFASGFDHFQVFDGFHAEVGEAPLLVASKFASAALLQIKFGEFKTVFSGFQSF